MMQEEIALENKEKVSKAVAESNKKRNGPNSVQMDGNEKPESKSHTSPTHTREQITKMAGVAAGTVARYDAIMKTN